MAPPELSRTLHVTAALFIPVTLAVKVCVVSLKTVTALGVTVTLADGEGRDDEEVELPPHPHWPNAAAKVSAMAVRRNPGFMYELDRQRVHEFRMLPPSGSVVAQAQIEAHGHNLTLG